jgi:hypothetical protein
LFSENSFIFLAKSEKFDFLAFLTSTAAVFESSSKSRSRSKFDDFFTFFGFGDSDSE